MLCVLVQYALLNFVKETILVSKPSSLLAFQSRDITWETWVALSSEIKTFLCGREQRKQDVYREVKQQDVLRGCKTLQGNSLRHEINN